MALIDYEAMATITDKRIVKSRRSIFEAIIILLKEKPMISITVTEVCRIAVINRKTFYTQYESVADAFEDMQKHIIISYLRQLEKEQILSFCCFKPNEYILCTHRIIEENRESFDILLPYLKSGNFMHLLGETLGQMGIRFAAKRPDLREKGFYPSALVFSITGLVTSYFDWIALGRKISIDELAQLATQLMEQPLNSILTK